MALRKRAGASSSPNVDLVWVQNSKGRQRGAPFFVMVQKAELNGEEHETGIH